jgi:hypothetical protein
MCSVPVCDECGSTHFSSVHYSYSCFVLRQLTHNGADGFVWLTDLTHIQQMCCSLHVDVKVLMAVLKTQESEHFFRQVRKIAKSDC